MTGGEPVFVGRGPELAQLTSGLEDALAGRGRLFLIAGEPGIGKSRLAESVAARARDAGCVVLSGRCWEAGGAPSYWPWVQSIRSYLRDIDEATVRQQIGDASGDLIQLLPELRTVFPGSEGSPTADSDAARFRLFDSMSSFLGRACRERPITFVLEDLHAADASSLLLLMFLTRQLAEMRILIVGTYRDVEVVRDSPLANALVELAREATTRKISLGGLHRGEVSDFIQETTGLSANSSLADAVFEETEGNPLFVGEIVRLLASEGRLNDDRAGLKPIPQGISDVIARRIDHLSEGSREILERASVLGREFTLDVLRELTGRPPEDLLERLDEARSARLVAETPGVLGGMRFSHVLIRDGIYESLPAAERGRLHQRAGEIVEQLYGDDPDHVSELAHHFLAAASISGTDKAVAYARKAGDAARSRLAFEEAARLYSMALQAMRADAANESMRFDIMLDIGDVLNRVGDAESARKVFLDAASIARRMDDAERLARAALGYGGQFPWTALRGDPHFIPLLEEALSRLGDSRSPVRVMVMGRLASGPLRDEPDNTRRRALGAEALAMAREIGDPTTLAYALEAQLGAILGPDFLPEITALTDEIEQLASETGDGEKILMMHLWRVLVALLKGDMRTVSLERYRVVQLAEQLRQGPQNWFILCTDASLAIFAGRFEEGRDLSILAFEAGKRAEPYALFAHRVQMLMIAIEQGRVTEMEEEFRDSATRFAIFPVWRAILPYLLLWYGDEHHAKAAVIEALSEQRPRNEEWTLAEGLLSDAVASVRDVDGASLLYEEFSPFAALTMGGIPDINFGSSERPLGRLATVLGRLDEAERHFRRAIEENDRMGARPFAAHARAELAEMLLDRDLPGDKDAAELLVQEASQVAHELGMRPLEEVCDRLFGRPLTQRLDAPAKNVFRREGDVYSVSFDGRAFRLRDSKGLRYLGFLLASPGKEHHALELVTAVEGTTAGTRTGEVSSPQQSGERLLDADAVAAYKQRISDLEEDITEAEGFGDSERAARARQEQAFVTSELAAAMGLGGKVRSAATDSERARLNVTRAIRSAIDRIRQNSPEMGAHLNATVSTGTFCSYTPDPRVPVTWRQ